MQPFVITINPPSPTVPCSPDGGYAVVQLGQIPQGEFPRWIDVLPLNFSQTAVQITPDTAIVGGPLRYNDTVFLNAQWNGQYCIATVIAKQ